MVNVASVAPMHFGPMHYRGQERAFDCSCSLFNHGVAQRERLNLGNLNPRAQTGITGGRGETKDTFAISRLWPVRRGYLTRELRSLMGEKRGEQTRVVTIIVGANLSLAAPTPATP